MDARSRWNDGAAGVPVGLPRRRFLTAVTLSPLVLAGCGFLRDDGPDPLVVLADAARADAALAAALVAADPALAANVGPLRDARTEHAAALDVEVARLDPDAPAPVPAPEPPGPTLDALRAAVVASGQAAGGVALGLPAERVGLVASVAACCATYAAVL